MREWNRKGGGVGDPQLLFILFGLLLQEACAFPEWKLLYIDAEGKNGAEAQQIQPWKPPPCLYF